MKRSARVSLPIIIGIALLAAGAAGYAFGGGQGSYCEEQVEIHCQKVFECYQGMALDSLKLVYGTSEGECRYRLSKERCDDRVPDDRPAPSAHAWEYLERSRDLSCGQYFFVARMPSESFDSFMSSLNGSSSKTRVTMVD